MNRCIYCLRDDNEVSFDTRDHIILRSLGGQRRLKKGIVCDICNNEIFSPIETGFTYDSIISISRQFNGPEGTHSLYRTKLHIMTVKNINEPCIGYIEQGGVPKEPLQFKVKGNIFECIANNEENLESEINRFIEIIKRIDYSKIKIEKDTKIKEKEPILCFYENRLYSYINKDDDIELIYKIIEQIKKNPSILNSNAKELESDKCYVMSHQTLVYSPDDRRVICKMVFNAIANYFGVEVALKDEFNDLRDFIHSSKLLDNFQFVDLISMINGSKFVDKFNISFPDNCHVLIIGNIYDSEGIIGILSLYNGAFEFIIHNPVVLNNISEFNDIRVIVVDYENNNEYEIIDKMIRENKRLEKEMFRKKI
jgi:hypothetical protein